MTINPGDKVVNLPTRSGIISILANTNIANGDNVILFPTPTGHIALKPAAISPGDSVVLVPSSGGKLIAFKTGSIAVPTIVWRYGHAAVLTQSGDIVVFGGIGAYTWNGSEWVIKDMVNVSHDGGYTWETVARGTPFGIAMLTNGAVINSNGRIILMNKSNQIWASSTNGKTWGDILVSGPGVEHIDFGFTKLHNDNIIIAGGRWGPYSNYLSDTWVSSDGGATWTLVSDGAAWGPRNEPACCTLSDNSILLVAGWQRTDDGVTWNKYQDDVWRSADGGATWTQQSSGQFPARYAGHKVVALSDGSAVLIGGRMNAQCLGDVWRSTDLGVTWVQQTASAEYGTVNQFACVVLPDDSIIIICGMGYTTEPMYGLGVWKSTDKGAHWTEICIPS